MTTILLWAVGVSGALALAAIGMASADRRKMTSQVAVVFLILAIFGGWATYFPAHAWAKASAVNGYHETLNGSVVAAPMKTIKCERDGECRHTYECDVTYTTRYYTDKDGKQQSEQVRHSHQCPYTTYEYSFWIVVDAYHEYTIPVALHIFGSKPEKFRRGWFHDPPDRVARGVPQKWVQARDAIARGDTLSATVPNTYPNYVLANEYDLYEEYSDKIDLLKSKRLMPDHIARLKDPIHDLIVADKVGFVGECRPPNPGAWQDETMRFNSNFGPNWQGDLRIVCLRASALNGLGVSPFDYAQALKAHWLNNLGKYAFPKNGVALVLAVSDDSREVVWSRAFTGMPKGNEGMLNRLSEFEHRTDRLEFDPQAVLGHTVTPIVHEGGKPKAVPRTTPGAVPDIVMSQEFGFKRPCMDCDDPGEEDQEGYVALKDEIPLSTGGTIGAVSFNTVVILGAWYVIFIVRMDLVPYRLPKPPRPSLSSLPKPTRIRPTSVRRRPRRRPPREVPPYGYPEDDTGDIGDRGESHTPQYLADDPADELRRTLARLLDERKGGTPHE
jgi:hypothetical protein